METQIDTTTIVDDGDDTLSLRDLPINDTTAVNSLRSSPRTSTTSAQDLFEFFSGTDPYPNRPDIIFCGKVIPNNDSDINKKRDYFGLTKSLSFRFRRPEHSVSDGGRRIITRSETETRSEPGRSSRTTFRYTFESGSVSERSSSPTVKFSTSAKKVNITSLTSMSASSRRRMFMFGPVKFKPEMDLTAIKERQGRRAPLPMFPAVVGGEGNGGGRGRCSHSSHWGIVRNLRCRAQRDHLSTVLVRSLGCIPSH